MRALLFVLAAFVPLNASAHAFGQQYTLPLPAELYIFGGSLALVLSFVLLILVPQHAVQRAGKDHIVGTKKTTGWIIALIQGAVFFALVLTILTGLFGHPNPADNLAPLMFWIYFLIGFTYLSVLVGGLWERVNPFVIDIPFLKHRSPDRVLPQIAYHVPALGLYLFLLWTELLSGGAGAVPQYIALGHIGYWLFSWIIIDLYGKDIWKEHFDVFGLFFRTVGILAPSVIRDD